MALQESYCSRKVFSTSECTFGTLNSGLLAIPKGNHEGGWDSIHVFEAIDRARTAHYKLTSTVILRLSTENDTLGSMDLSGNMTRQIEQDMPVTDDSSHIVNVGKLVEDMESKMRNLLREPHDLVLRSKLIHFIEEVYFGKAKDVVGDLRSTSNTIWASLELTFTLGIPPLSEASREKASHKEMIESMAR